MSDDIFSVTKINVNFNLREFSFEREGNIRKLTRTGDIYSRANSNKITTSRISQNMIGYFWKVHISLKIVTFDTVNIGTQIWI